MEKEQLTTEEIERLSKSPYVKLARDTANKAKQQKLYRSRSLDKKGAADSEKSRRRFGGIKWQSAECSQR